MKLTYLVFPNEVQINYDTSIIGNIPFGNSEQKIVIQNTLDLLIPLIDELNSKLEEKEPIIYEIITLATSD